MGLQEEDSITDLSNEDNEKIKDQVFYYASDKQEDSEEDIAKEMEIKLKLRDNREILLPPRKKTNQEKRKQRK